MKKSAVKILSVSLLSTFLLAGCGGSSSSDSAPKPVENYKGATSKTSTDEVATDEYTSTFNKIWTGTCVYDKLLRGYYIETIDMNVDTGVGNVGFTVYPASDTTCQTADLFTVEVGGKFYNLEKTTDNNGNLQLLADTENTTYTIHYDTSTTQHNMNLVKRYFENFIHSGVYRTKITYKNNGLEFYYSFPNGFERTAYYQ